MQIASSIQGPWHQCLGLWKWRPYCEEYRKVKPGQWELVKIQRRAQALDTARRENLYIFPPGLNPNEPLQGASDPFEIRARMYRQGLIRPVCPNTNRSAVPPGTRSGTPRQRSRKA